MSEKRFGSFENQQEMYDLLEKQAIIIEDLERENEQLRKELTDCEKFRYTVFKRLNKVE